MKVLEVKASTYEFLEDTIQPITDTFVIKMSKLI